MKQKGRSILLLTILLAVLTTAVWADIGPKASVHVSFRDIGEGTCYGTLLSEQKSTGPATAYDGTGFGRPQEFYQDRLSVEGAQAEAIWEAFQGYAAEDDFYFLQHWWTCSGDGGIHWTYYPPQTFKVLLYYPDTDTFLVSQVEERYAFDSYFEATPTLEGGLALRHNYRFGMELLSLTARVVLTILLELGVAWLFRYREKKVLLYIGAVNVATQLGLNLVLNLVNYRSGQMAYVLAMVPLEIVIFLVEGFLYTRGLRRLRGEGQAGHPMAYALSANALSFGLGLWLSFVIPGIF